MRDQTINKANRSRLTNSCFSLITCNCLGEILCKRLRACKDSPTSNFYFNTDDYIKFCMNLNYYLSLTICTFTGEYSGAGENHFVESLDDLKLFLVHL